MSHSSSSSSPSAALALAGVLLLALTTTADAQNLRGRNQVYEHIRNSEKLRKVFAPTVAKAFPATVHVFSDDRRVALGTVVGEAGLILTKASEIAKGEVTVAFGGSEEKLAASLVGIDDPNDLAILRIEKKGLPKVTFAIDNGTKTGSFVVTASTEATPLAYGIMSVARHARPLPDQKTGFLGVRSEAANPGMRLTEIIRDSAASEAGLERGDVIVLIDGTAVRDSQHFMRSIKRKKPGEKLSLKVRRGEQTIEVVATLGRNSSRHGTISSQERSRLWGPVSEVRLGFEEVIQHDTVIRPRDCGGPLCNLKGEVVGINISRVGRFETLAVTSKVVARSIAKIVARARAAKNIKRTDREVATSRDRRRGRAGG